MAMFDTLKAARRLTDAGFDEEKAGAIVSAFAEDINERVATKDDLRQLEERFDQRLTSLDQHLTIRIGMVATTATGVLLAAIAIATGVIVSL